MLLSPVETTVFYWVFYAWFLSEFLGAWIIPRLRGSVRVRTTRDRGSGLLIIFTVLIAIGVAFAFSSADITPLPDWVFYLGIAMVLMRIAVRQWAIAVLGRFFSLAVRVQADHRIVDKGPYRLVRHPSYTGAILSLLGLSLTLETWGATLLLAVVFGVAYGYRIHVEEKALVTELGNGYVAYMKRTKRLIPFLF